MSAPVQRDGTVSAEAYRLHSMDALAHGPLSFEWRHHRPDGTEWDAQVYLARFNYRGRTLLQFSLDDITERLTRAKIGAVERKAILVLERFDVQ
jgi:hypothetical protein